MLTYGYVLSNLPRSERYKEAEKLLDMLLKGYEKENAVFEKDGSVKQCYKKTDEDGTVHETVLERNMSESHISVYSDRSIKLLRLGRLTFYLRDILPSLVFFLLYIVWAIPANTEAMESGSSDKMLAVIIGGSMAALALNLTTGFILDKNRTKLRIRFIQFGGLFNFLFTLHKMTSYTGVGGIIYFWQHTFAYTPFIEIVGGIMLTWVADKFTRRY